MAITLQDKLAGLDPARRGLLVGEADRLQIEYLMSNELGKVKSITQVQSDDGTKLIAPDQKVSPTNSVKF